MKSQVLHTVWCNISGEAAGEVWTWSLLGVKGLILAYCSSSAPLLFNVLSFVCRRRFIITWTDYKRKRRTKNTWKWRLTWYDTCGVVRWWCCVTAWLTRNYVTSRCRRVPAPSCMKPHLQSRLDTLGLLTSLRPKAHTGAWSRDAAELP